MGDSPGACYLRPKREWGRLRASLNFFDPADCATRFRQRSRGLRRAGQREWACRTFSSSIPKRTTRIFPTTRLTQSYRRQASGGASRSLPVKAAPRPTTICRNCAVPIEFGDKFCQACSVVVAGKNLIEAAKLGCVATHSPKAEALRAATMRRRQETANRAWRPSGLPSG